MSDQNPHSSSAAGGPVPGWLRKSPQRVKPFPQWLHESLTQFFLVFLGGEQKLTHKSCPWSKNDKYHVCHWHGKLIEKSGMMKVWWISPWKLGFPKWLENDLKSLENHLKITSIAVSLGATCSINLDSQPTVLPNVWNCNYKSITLMLIIEGSDFAWTNVGFSSSRELDCPRLVNLKLMRCVSH